MIAERGDEEKGPTREKRKSKERTRHQPYPALAKIAMGYRRRRIPISEVPVIGRPNVGPLIAGG